MANLRIGQLVINFGVVATVVDFHPVTGDPILHADGIGNWVASASKCSELA